MFELYFKVIAGVGAASLLFATGLYRWHNESDLFAVISLFCWAVLSFASDNLVVLDGAGGTAEFGSFPMQLFCAGMALVSVFVLIGAVTGAWPSDEPDGIKELPKV